MSKRHLVTDFTADAEKTEPRYKPDHALNPGIFAYLY